MAIHRIMGVPATQELINKMKGKIRESDKQEVWAASHRDIDDTLDLSFKASELCFVGLFDDIPMIAFGVVRPFLLSRKGIIWMLGTDCLEKKLSKISLALRCRQYIEKMFQSFDELTNYVDIRNKISINWLEWMLFTLEEPVPYGPDNMLFKKFYMRK